MKKLFDETHEYGTDDYRRTLWYGYFDKLFDIESIDQYVQLIKNTEPEPLQKTITETHWIFYGAKPEEDAIGDKVRPTVMVRKKSGVFLVNCNLSDCDFAANLDTIYMFKKELEKKLQLAFKEN